MRQLLLRKFQPRIPTCSEPNYVLSSPHLLGSFPDQVNGSRSGGWRRENRDAEFVPGDVERIFSLGAVPIRERTALNVLGVGLICLILVQNF